MKNNGVSQFYILIVVLMIGTLMMHASFAKDVGVMGETYPIAEMDFLIFIQSRVQSMQKNGELQSIEKRIKQDAIHYRDRPKAVSGIIRASHTKSWDFDPSIVLDHDLITPDGKIVALAGTHVNPLLYVPLTNTLIFYNADDPDQVKWVLSQDKALKGKDKLILVNGSVLSQEKLFKKPIYFDQAGKLTERFNIMHVPAMIFQKNSFLHIMEVRL